LASREHQLKVRVLGSPPVTPVKVDRLEQLLTGYSSGIKTFLVDGFRFGFSIHFVGERSSFESPNLKSALRNYKKKLTGGGLLVLSALTLFLLFEPRPLA